MTPEAQLTLLTIERYLIKNPGVRLGQALYHLHIIQFKRQSNVAHTKLTASDVYADNDTKVMSRVIKSFPFRQTPQDLIKKPLFQAMPNNQEIDLQLSIAEDSKDNSDFPDLTYEDGVISALKWVTGQTNVLPMEP